MTHRAISAITIKLGVLMKEFFQQMLGAVVLGAVLAYFFGLFWFWVIMVLAFFGGIQAAFRGIQAARNEKKYTERFGGSSDSVTGSNPKSRSQAAYKAENAAEIPVPVDPYPSRESENASNPGFLHSGGAGNRNGEASIRAGVSEAISNHRPEEKEKTNMGKTEKAEDGSSQTIKNDIAGNKDSSGVTNMSERRDHATEETSSSVNPFSFPIVSLLKSLSGINWTFPFLPQVIESVVLILALGLTAILYLTVGIASQIERTLLSLMRNAGRGASDSNVIERSAYAIAGVIYLVVWLPFWLVLLPFNVLGWLWQTFGYGGIVALLLVIVTITGLMYWGIDLGAVFDSVRYGIGLPS